MTGSPHTDEQLFQILLDKEGMSEEQFVNVYSDLAVAPGICREPGCLAIKSDCELDMRAGYCEVCGATATVKSGFVLMGCI